MDERASLNLVEIFKLQYEQQLHINGPLPLERNAQRQLAQRYIAAAQTELVGYLDAIAFKDFFPGREKPRSTRLIELVDAFKYILAAAWTEGITPNEFAWFFEDKTRLINERWAQRHSIGLGEKVCGFDMDGVLCRYDVLWEPTEQEFCERGGVLEIEPIEGARDTLLWLKERGWTIVVVTARKRHLIERLDQDTRAWLRKHEMPFDSIIFNHDKGWAIKETGADFRFFVDDSVKHALDVANAVEQSYLFGRKSRLGISMPNYQVRVVDDHTALRGDLEAWFDQHGI